MIDRQGQVAMAQDGSSDIPSEAVRSCIVKSFYSLSFPSPDNGTVTVVYPMVLTPAELIPATLRHCAEPVMKDGERRSLRLTSSIAVSGPALSAGTLKIASVHAAGSTSNSATSRSPTRT